MGAFFETIINFIQAIFAFVTNIISGTVQMLLMIPQAVSFLTYSLGFMPSVIAVVVTALITVNVVYLIIGR